MRIKGRHHWLFDSERRTGGPSKEVNRIAIQAIDNRSHKRARCPYRAAREIRVGNGGAIMTSRRVRGPAAHRAAGGEPPLASRGMQNSQRVLLAKPRTAVVSRHGQ